MNFRPFNFIKDGYIGDNTTTPNVIYHGFYNPDPQSIKTSSGSLDTAAAQFLIAKETQDAGGVTLKMEWAYTTNQPLTYNQIWNNRATSLTYR